jgi:hypothetical protein
MDRSQLTHNQYVEVYRIATACGHTYGFEAGGGAMQTAGTANPFLPNQYVGYAESGKYALLSRRLI